MSDIDDLEKVLREFAASRQKFAGSGPLQIPGPMRERLRAEIESMNDCDSVFERKSGFQIATLLRILIPTAAVAAVAVVSFQTWDLGVPTSAGPQVATSLHKEEQKKASDPVKALKEDSANLLAMEMPRPEADAEGSEVPVVVAAPSRRPAAIAKPVSLAENSSAVVPEEREMLSSSVSTTGSGRIEELQIVTEELKMDGDLKLQQQVASQPAALNTYSRDLPMAAPSDPGYGEPREATLAPTVPEHGDRQLNQPLETIRFRSTAQGSILWQFSLRRSGDTIELIDSDGSRYTADLAQLKDNLRETAKVKRARIADELPVEHFVVSGVNQTLGRELKVIGTIFPAPLVASDKAAAVGTGAAANKTRIRAVINVSGQSSPVSIEAESE